jgi:hypothetical protein
LAKKGMSLAWKCSLPAAQQGKRIVTVSVPDLPSGIQHFNLPLNKEGKGTVPLLFEAALQPGGPSDLLKVGKRDQLQLSDFSLSAWLVEVPRGQPAQDAQSVPAEFDPAGGTVSLNIPQSRKNGAHRLWYVRAEPNASIPLPPLDTDVSAWTVPHDDKPENADRILNIQDLVDEIGRHRARTTLAPSAAALLTD